MCYGGGNTMSTINKWLHSAAGRVSVLLIIASIVLLILAWSSLVIGFLSADEVIFVNNVLIGLATNMMGIVVTVSFVQYFLDKQNEEKERKEEKKKILRYHKYMQTLIHRYLIFYMSITTRLADRKEAGDVSNAFTRTFEFSDMADMYQTSLYVSEGLSESSIELYYKAERELRNYMLKMLESIDFKYNTELATLLLDFTIKSTNLDMSGQLLEVATKKKYGIGKKNVELVEKWIADESYDWLGKFNRDELQGNLMLPYVTLYYLCQDQIRMIKEYTEYIKKLEL
jgi:hypothetical protein